jgi:hypothetical protein
VEYRILTLELNQMLLSVHQNIAAGVGGSIEEDVARDSLTNTYFVVQAVASHWTRMGY